MFWKPFLFSVALRSLAVFKVKGDLAVVGIFSESPIGSINAAGKKNVDGNRPILSIAECKL